MKRYSKKYRPYEYWANLVKGEDLKEILLHYHFLKGLGMKPYQLVSMGQEIVKKLRAGEIVF